MESDMHFMTSAHIDLGWLAQIVARLSVLGLCFVASQSFAQSPNTQDRCGTVLTQSTIDFQLDEFPRLLEASRRQPRLGTPFYFPLAIHIVRRSSHTGGFRLGQLDTALVDLNNHYTQLIWKFFVFGPIDYIDDDNTFLNTDTHTEYDALRGVNRVTGAINVYFLDLPSGLLGLSSFPQDEVQGILIDINAAGVPMDPATLAHEVGHYFGLFHTHETYYGVECPSGINCLTAGDQCCDTPADPNLDGHVSATCVYDNAVPLPGFPCDNTHYSPATDNVMSYSQSLCMTNFTTCQIDRMYAIATTVRAVELFERTVFVDGSYVGPELGLPWSPFNSLLEALAAAGSGDVIFLEPGVYPENALATGKAILMNWDALAGSVVIGN